MATPAASAFHRRRLMYSSAGSPPLTAAQHHSTAQRPRSVPPALSTVQQPSIQRPYLQQSPAPARLPHSFSSFFFSFLSPFLSFAHTTLPDLVVSTLTSLVLAHIIRSFLLSTLGAVFLSCSAPPPPLPLSVVFVNILLIVPLILIVLITHFLLFRSTTSSPPIPLMHLLTSILTTPPLALIFSYMIYGPYLSPHMFFCTSPSSIFPSQQSVNTPVLAAFFTAPALTFLIFRLRPHNPPPFPFPRSPLRRALSAFVPALILSILPTLPAFVPTFLSALISRPSRSFYPSMLLTLSRTLSATFASTAALLPHSLLLSYHPQSDTPSSTPPSPASLQHARTALAQANSIPPPQVRSALNTLTAHPACMHPFPPFADPSARLWRATLESALAPLIALVEHLRPPVLQTDVRELIHPTHASSTSNMTSTAPPPPYIDVVDGLATLRYLPTLFAASRRHDSFGVVHPTLPRTLVLLLLVRARAISFLDGPPTERPLSWLPRLPSTLRGPPATAGLEAIVDAATVCIYRFVDLFREQAVRFVEGREVAWDNDASAELSNFLKFIA